MSGPIFVHGVYPRSGTNHLLNLLCAHPDCAPPSPLWEDFLLAHAEHLERYVADTAAHWSPGWGAGEEHAERLRRALGDGLLGFLEELAGARPGGPRLATKTPDVRNLALFPALFPRASLVILVRDGRAVVESGVRSFGWFRDRASHGWAEAARAVAAFEAQQAPGAARHTVVRYESLVEQPETTLRELFGRLGLDAARYDFDAAKALPVWGSSSLAAEPGGRVHWQGSDREADFDPLARFAHWSRRRHSRFNWIAGDALRSLGYAPAETGDGALDALRNGALDVAYRAALALRPLRAAWRSRARR